MPTNSTEYQYNYWKKNRTKKSMADDAQRHRARYKLEKIGRVKKGDWKEVDHKWWLKKWNGLKNLRVLPKKVNRALWTKKTLAKRKARKANWGKY